MASAALSLVPLLRPEQAAAPTATHKAGHGSRSALSSASTVLAATTAKVAEEQAKKNNSTTPGGGTSVGSQPNAAPTNPITFPTHTNITTTVFWVGEPATAQNGYIHNSASTWDESWETHYGGFDNPNSRNGYLPSGFTPGENPFYFALPYSDLDDNGNRRPSANSCPEAASKQNQPISWCKNTWVAITNQANNKTCYAQWEDAGPYGENDTAYVFGSSPPANHADVKAGLDVSPAARDCLGMGDVATTTWRFVTGASVPAGPWKNIITTTPSYSVN